MSAFRILQSLGSVLTHLRNAVCAVLVAFNSFLQIILYAPFGILYINVMAPASNENDIVISYSTVAKSVAAFLGASSSAFPSADGSDSPPT